VGAFGFRSNSNGIGHRLLAVGTVMTAAPKRKAPRKAPQPSEKQVETAIINRLMFYGVLCQPNRNEARSAAVGRSAKILGTISGFPDLTVISSDGRTAYMEVKTPKAKPRNAKDAAHWRRQADILASLRRMGHKAEIVRSQDEAVALLQEWGWIKP